MKKLILSAVVATAAVFGAYTANQTSNEVASLGLLDASAIEAEGAGPGDGGNNAGNGDGSYYPHAQQGTQVTLKDSMSGSANGTYGTGDHNKGGSISAGVDGYASGEYHNIKSDSSYTYHRDTLCVREYKVALVFPCVGTSGERCEPSIIILG